jgi:molybdate transport system ATP-binding protein
MNYESKGFDLRIRIALEQFDLEIEYQGSERVLGVFGVSGSGKTTLLECLAGLRQTCTGLLKFEDSTWMDSKAGICLPPEKRSIGYVPQDHLLFPHCNVRENLEIGKRRALANGVDFPKIFESVISVLELESLLDRNVERLSGGERQRVALARALCSGPRLLLLDEPLSSLDATLRRRILPYLIRVRDTFELPMVIVSHNPMELQALCGEVLIMKEGKLLARGRPEDVFIRSDVFDTAKEQGFENVFSGRIVETGERTMVLGLLGGCERLRVPVSEGAIGETCVASIASDDILIATEPPRGLSARNCIAARIERIEATGLRFLAVTQVGTGEKTFVVELTKDAIDELDLKPGRDVYLVFKTNAVRV